MQPRHGVVPQAAEASNERAEKRRAWWARSTARIAGALALFAAVGAVTGGALAATAPSAGATTTSCSVGFPANAHVVGMAATPSGGGYWEVDQFGDVVTFGNAPCDGSLTGTSLDAPVVGMAATPSGNGYWLVAADGGVFTFGHASFYGSLGSVTFSRSMVGMDATPDGGGYWLVTSGGGVFAFGNARIEPKTS